MHANCLCRRIGILSLAVLQTRWTTFIQCFLTLFSTDSETIKLDMKTLYDTSYSTSSPSTYLLLSSLLQGARKAVADTDKVLDVTYNSSPSSPNRGRTVFREDIRDNVYGCQLSIRKVALHAPQYDATLKHARLSLKLCIANMSRRCFLTSTHMVGVKGIEYSNQ